MTFSDILWQIIGSKLCYSKIVRIEYSWIYIYVYIQYIYSIYMYWIYTEKKWLRDLLLIFRLHIKIFDCINGYVLSKASKRSFLHGRQDFFLCIALCLSQVFLLSLSGCTQILILDKVFNIVLSCMRLLFLAVLDSICYCFAFQLALLSDPKAPWPALTMVNLRLVNLRLVMSIAKIFILLLVYFQIING